MSKQLSFAAVMAFTIALAGPLQASDSWSLSKLNPFKKKAASATAASRARASFSDESPQYGGFPYVSKPTWGFQTTASPTPQRKEPSTLAKWSQGTKDFFGKTKSVLMPWTNSSKKKSRSTRSTSRGMSSKKKSSSSFLTSWLPKKEEKKRPKTVKDFLAQPRPGY